MNEGLIDGGGGGMIERVEESDEAEGEDVGGGEVVVFKGTLGAEQERVEPLQLLIHFHSPTLVR